jgi:WD40 repeat protein
MSLLIYAIDTDESTTVLENYGHIAAIWTLTNELIISTWDDRITVYAVFKPDHQFLYNPQSEQIIELDWPTGNGTRIVGYWSEGNSFLLANYSDGLVQISRDGTSAPIPLPVRPYSSHFIMSPDGRFVAYAMQCGDEYTSWTCFAVYELGSNNVETITAFAETYEVSGYFEFSPTGRYIAVLLDRYHVGIYDLEQNEIAFELSEADANDLCGRDEDLLFIAVADTTTNRII